MSKTEVCIYPKLQSLSLPQHLFLPSQLLASFQLLKLKTLESLSSPLSLLPYIDQSGNPITLPSKYIENPIFSPSQCHHPGSKLPTAHLVYSKSLNSKLPPCFLYPHSPHPSTGLHTPRTKPGTRGIQ